MTFSFHRYLPFLLLVCGLLLAIGLPAYAGSVVTTTTVQYNLSAWSDVTAVTAGESHVAGLRTDGTVATIGSNTYGQCDVTDWTGINAIAAGKYHTVGLHVDGAVVAAGRNTNGQCNVSTWAGIVAITAGGNHTVGLRADGTVVATGRNTNGQCNVDAWTAITAIAAGTEHTVGLHADGTVVATGLNTSGQCNVEGWSNIIAIAAGGQHTVGLRADGTVLATGSTSYGQCDIDGWTGVTAIAAGSYHTVGLRADGTVVAAGRNTNGQCNVDAWTEITAIATGELFTIALQSDPTVVATGLNTSGQCNVKSWKNITVLAAGSSHTVGLRANGTLIATGSNVAGQCNIDNWTNMTAVAAGRDHTVGLCVDGTVLATGNNDDGQCEVESWTAIAAIAAGARHTVGLQADGTVVATGANDAGQCNVEDWSNIIAIAAGDNHTIGLRADGTVVATGLNAAGQCDIGAWTGIAAIAAGAEHTVGLRANAMLKATGSNTSGQSTLGNWYGITSIACGSNHTVALRYNGKLVAVGANDNRQCNVTDWTKICGFAAGGFHTVALTLSERPVFTTTPRAGENGQISPSTAQRVGEGGSITFTATPKAGYAVDTWYVGGIAVQTGGTTFRLTYITANQIVLVTFKQLIFTMTPSAGANGSISPDTPQQVMGGDAAIFTASPETGYRIDRWFVDGQEAQVGGDTLILNQVAADHTVAVTFTILTYTVTPSAGEHGTIAPDAPQTVEYNGEITFTAMPETGYTVDTWFVDGEAVQTEDASFTLREVTVDQTVLVTFKPLIFTVTPSAGEHGEITPDAPQTMPYNGEITFTAIPQVGYTVDRWWVNGMEVQTGGTSFILDHVAANGATDLTVEVSFTMLIYTVTPSAGEHGTLTPDTARTVSHNGDVVFTAVPETGYTVDSWLVDGVVAQTGGTTFWLNGVTTDQTVQVTFAPEVYTVLPVAGANGAISPATKQLIRYGEQLTFTAMPKAGYAVGAWSVDGAVIQRGGSTFTLSQVMDDCKVAVTFTRQSSVTITPSAGLHGTINPRSTISTRYNSTITLTAYPYLGYDVDSWYVDGEAVQAGGKSLILSEITASHTVRVTFKMLVSTITPSAGEHGVINPDTAQMVTAQQTLVLTATPDTGYQVDAWFVDGRKMQTGGATYTMRSITADHTVLVTFKPRTYIITPSVTLHGTLTPNRSMTAEYGSSITFTAIPAIGYQVNTWFVDGKAVQTGSSTLILDQIQADHTVRVTFTRQTFIITPSSGENGTVNPSAPVTVNYGSSLRLSATPNHSYTVDSWTVDGIVKQTGGMSFLLTNITADQTVLVTFK